MKSSGPKPALSQVDRAALAEKLQVKRANLQQRAQELDVQRGQRADALDAKRRQMQQRALQLEEKRRQTVLKLEERRRKTGNKLEEQQRKRRRRLMILLAILLLILLAMLQDCSCSPPPPPEDPGPGVAVEGEPEPAVEEEPTPISPRIPRKDRPEYYSGPPKPLPWLAAFRMQVAARSPRLATCFVGAQRPGQLKWTTSVEPGQGRVSDHALEPMLLTDELTGKERQCVLQVLSDPPYRLESEEERTTPSRVGMVIEF